MQSQSIWRGSVFLDRLVNGTWHEIPIGRGFERQDFANADSALATALGYGRSFVDALRGLASIHCFRPLAS